MVTLIVGDRTLHPRMIEEICREVTGELGVSISHQAVDRPDEIGALLASAADDAPVVVCPGDGGDLHELTGAGWPETGRVVRVDVARRAPDRSPGLAAHIQARGIDGLRWALRTAIHHRDHRFRPVRYGALTDQWGELLLPARGSGPLPVAVLIHGGYWHDRWQLDLMDAMAVDLAAQGMACWNIEYRRPDAHGWAATVSDVRAALDYVHELAETEPIDPRHVVVIGHSAGGQLAVRACADAAARATGTPPLACVSLAGVLDLVAAARRELGERAVPVALGAEPATAEGEYRASSPLARIPVGVPTIVATAEDDSRDLTEMGWRYSAVARSLGDEVQEIHGPGGHFALIDPSAQVWVQVRSAILARIAESSI